MKYAERVIGQTGTQPRVAAKRACERLRGCRPTPTQRINLILLEMYGAECHGDNVRGKPYMAQTQKTISFSKTLKKGADRSHSSVPIIFFTCDGPGSSCALQHLPALKGVASDVTGTDKRCCAAALPSLMQFSDTSSCSGLWETRASSSTP